MLLWLTLLACQGEPALPRPEPIALPDDPALPGAPVGVRTVTEGDLVLEVFHPAPDHVVGGHPFEVSLSDHLTAEVLELLEGVELPSIDTGAWRNVPLREPVSPYPLVFFSHGFGGFRTQSVTLAVHLASRGYVVVAPDHRGRRLADVLPCVFSPPLAGCDIASEDPGLEDIPAALEAALRWAAEEGHPMEGRLRLEGHGLMGHSAGGNTTSTVGSVDDRFTALAPMAGNVEVTRDVPLLVVGGTCDGVVPFDDTEAAWRASAGGQLLGLHGAGHLAFTDLCSFDLGYLAEEVLAEREDVNQLLLPAFTEMAVDGCEGYLPPEGMEDCQGGYLPQEVSEDLLRHYLTVFFDHALLGAGPGVTEPEGDDARLW